MCFLIKLFLDVVGMFSWRSILVQLFNSLVIKKLNADLQLQADFAIFTFIQHERGLFATLSDCSAAQPCN